MLLFLAFHHVNPGENSSQTQLSVWTWSVHQSGATQWSNAGSVSGCLPHLAGHSACRRAPREFVVDPTKIRTVLLPSGIPDGTATVRILVGSTAF